MDSTHSKKPKKTLNTANPLESLKDVPSASLNSAKEDLIKKMPKEMLEQLFGQNQRNFSGEIIAGESLEINEVYSGEHEKNQLLRRQVKLERSLRIEDTRHVEKKRNDLKMQLSALQQEVLVLAQSTQELNQEIQVAAMQAPVETGVYYVIFFQKLLEFIKSFRKKINNTNVWLHASNARAAKKNAWGANYKKHGSKYLLSSEHYVSRSAG